MFKKFTRVFTSRKWRGHKRRLFFQELFNPLKDRENLDYGSFTLIDDSFSSYKTSCHELAVMFDFYPLDKRYPLVNKRHPHDKQVMNIGRIFATYNIQRYDYLVVTIERLSSIWQMLTGYCMYRVFVEGEENRTNFSFSYDKRMKIF